MSSDEQTWSIGAVSRLTGIPTDTIRTWERRYEAVIPVRTDSGHRLYSQEHVERLQRLAKLVEQGERVSDLAALTDSQLSERLALYRPTASGIPRVLRATVVHERLADHLAGVISGVSCDVHVVASAVSPATLRELATTDVLVVDLAVLGATPVPALSSLIDRVQPASTVVTTSLIARPLRQQLAGLGVRLVQQPVSVRDLRQTLLDAFVQSGHASPSVPSDEPVPPRFSDGVLEQLLNTRSDLLCECPTHVASLVIAMRQFEVYSQNCASETEEDAALHSDLARESGRMRERLEELLIRVCEHDGIDWTG